MDQPRPPRQHPALYVLLILGILALVIAIFGAVTAGRRDRTPAPVPAVPSPSETADTWQPSQPALPSDVHVSWVYLDSTEGSMLHGGDLDQHPLDQLVVPGIAADYLDRFGQGGQNLSPRDTATLTAALAQNGDAGDQLARDAGGTDVVFPRIIDNCQLTETQMGPPRATAADVARYAACLREGATAAPDTSAWVLDQMRQTAGGIGDVRGNDGGQRLAQFNSTVPAGDGRMRTACMGVGAYWSAGIFVDWPTDRPELFGVTTCAEVAAAQFPPDTQQAPDSPAPTDLSSTCPYDTCRGTD